MQGAIDPLARSRHSSVLYGELHRTALLVQASVIAVSASLQFLASLLALLERTLGLATWAAGCSLTLHAAWFALHPLARCALFFLLSTGVAAVVWLSLDLTLCGWPGRTLLLFARWRARRRRRWCARIC